MLEIKGIIKTGGNSKIKVITNTKGNKIGGIKVPGLIRAMPYNF
jgi:hypothetical protein